MPTGGSTDVASKGVTSPESKPKPPADTKSDAAVTKTVGEKAMGSRWSGAAASGGKAPSTASGSSTHTASTVPADSVEVKSSTLPGRTSGVAGFLRRKPSVKTAAEASGRRVSDVAAAGGSAAEKPAKKGVGSALRSSLFKRKGKASPAAAAGEDRPAAAAAAAAAGALAEKERPPSGRGSTSPPKAQQPASRGSQDSTAATARRKTPSPRARKAPSPAPRKSPSPTPHKAPTPAPAGHHNAGHDKGSTSSPTAGVAGKKSPAGSDRPAQALTPAAKEALKKNWFTDGQPSAASEPVSRSTTRSMTETRSRPDRSGDAVGPPAKVSRVSEAVTSLNAKSGGKGPPKPRPASPKKSTGAGNTTESGDITDSMDSKSAFKAVNAGAVKAKHSTKSRTSRTGAGMSKSPDSSVTEPKPDGKGASTDGGLSGLMSVMDGFSPDGSKAGTRTKDTNIEGTNTPSDAGKNKIDHANAKEMKPDPSHKNGARHDQKSMEVEKSVPDQDKSLHMVSGDKTAARGDKKSTESTMDGIESNIESKVSKTAAWRPGDDDGGELGLGGVSRKNRQDRAERPSAPKSDIADLDFLSSVIQKSPKTPDPPKSPKTSEKPTEKGKSQEKTVEEEKGLGDLMSLAKDFDISTLSKFEPVTAEVKPDVQSADMDKFLDFMITEPAKPAAPSAPAAEKISEPSIAAAKTWRTGDDDDEKMTELKNKKRDHDAPSQAPEWDIDDLVTDVLSSKPKGKAAAGTDRQQDDGDKRLTDKGLSAFDDFLTGTLSEKASSADREVEKPSPSTASAKTKGSVPRKVHDEGFDKLSSDSLDKSLPLLSSAACHEEHVDAPKKVSAVDSAPGSALVDVEVITAVATASHTTAKPGNKRKPVSDKHLEKHGDTRGSCPDHGHGVRDVLYDDNDKTGRKNSDSKSGEQHREPVALDDIIQPVKASSTSSAPQREEAAVALTAASTESAKKPTDKKATGKHIEKHGDTRGSCPDHGHGVRDVLYDDDDKTGRKSSASKGASKPREPAVLDDLIQPVKASSTSSAPHPVTGADEAVVALTATSTESAVGPTDKKATDKHIEKHGDTRGSCPDHGHGVRDILYDDKDKTGRKSSASKGASKPREPAVLDDLIQTVKASSTSSAPHPVTGAEEAVVALTAASTESAKKPTDKKATGKHIEKHGDTRGSCPDHGHGVRDILYDDKDKTGRKSSASKGASKPREPAVLDDLIQPVKASSTSSAPHPVTGADKAVVALTAASTESAVKPADKKTTDKHIEKHGDTRGSCPDHGHGVRDLLYDDSDKTGTKKPTSKGSNGHREPAVLDDLIRPVKASSTSSSPQKEELVTAQTTVSVESVQKVSGKKATDKHVDKHGDTRGSCPDHGHGVRDVLYDDSDKTGRSEKGSAAKGDKPREPADLDNLIRPIHASTTSSAVPQQPPDNDRVTSSSAHTTAASPQLAKGKQTNSKHVDKEGNTRGSVPDHGHGLRDVLYDKSDKTGGGKMSESKGERKTREPADLDDLVVSTHASHTATQPSQQAAHHPPGADAPLVAAAASTTQTAPPAAAAGADAPLGAAAASTTQTAPLAATATATAPPPPHQAERDPPKKSVSLAGMTDPDDEDEDDGEELRRLIASTEALQEKLHAYVSHADSKQEQAVQEETSRELEQLERRLEQKERRLESAGRGRDVQAIKDGLRKVKQQLDTSRTGK